VNRSVREVKCKLLLQAIINMGFVVLMLSHLSTTTMNLFHILLHQFLQVDSYC